MLTKVILSSILFGKVNKFLYLTNKVRNLCIKHICELCSLRHHSKLFRQPCIQVHNNREQEDQIDYHRIQYPWEYTLDFLYHQDDAMLNKTNKSLVK